MKGHSIKTFMAPHPPAPAPWAGVTIRLPCCAEEIQL